MKKKRDKQQREKRMEDLYEHRRRFNTRESEILGERRGVTLQFQRNITEEEISGKSPEKRENEMEAIEKRIQKWRKR